MQNAQLENGKLTKCWSPTLDRSSFRCRSSRRRQARLNIALDATGTSAAGMKGIFGLVSPNDLYEKLLWEYERTKEGAEDQYAAYNFFVTAWHLVEWKYPGNTNVGIRNELKARNPILGICEHIAVGAKHFEPTNPKLTAVEATPQTTIWGDKVWAEGVWKEGVWANWLTVELTGDAAAAFGKRVRVEDLVEAAIAFWRSEMQSK
ncbi:MAG: hypothetical protein H6977_10360 [Gammaproteobacteria bacterium]|nr:hypothetical protein [Gammaproteobacteria bacterium]